MALEPITAILEAGGKIIDKFVPDPNSRAKAKEELEAQTSSQEFQLLLGQIEVNKEEAKSESLFKSGWRPFIGWTCGFSLVYAGIIEPISRFIAMVLFKYIGPFPIIDTQLTIQILLALLGIAGMRSYDKYKGTAK